MFSQFISHKQKAEQWKYELMSIPWGTPGKAGGLPGINLNLLILVTSPFIPSQM